MDDYVRKTIDVYDTIAQFYAKRTVDYAPEREREKFIQRIKSQGKILDAGCGPGRDSAFFAEKGFQVVGIDLSGKLLEIAKQKASTATFLKQDFRNLDFSPSTFDGIWACASLLHLKKIDIPNVLKKFYELLQPEGILFIMVKEGRGEADVQESISSNLSRHFTYFDREEISKLLKQTGFAIEEVYTFNERDRDKAKRNLIWIASFSKKT